MSDLTIWAFILSAAILTIGLKTFKIEKSKGETEVTFKDILAILLIAVGVTGTFFALQRFQIETVGLGTSGPVVQGETTETETGSSSCNIVANGVQCSATVTYTKAFQNRPVVTVSLINKTYSPIPYIVINWASAPITDPRAQFQWFVTFSAILSASQTTNIPVYWEAVACRQAGVTRC